MKTKVFPLGDQERRVLHALVLRLTELKKNLAAHKEDIQKWLDQQTGTTFKGTHDRQWTVDYQYLVVSEREPLVIIEGGKGNEAQDENQKV